MAFVVVVTGVDCAVCAGHVGSFGSRWAAIAAFKGYARLSGYGTWRLLMISE
jgi:hypothetical protein